MFGRWLMLPRGGPDLLRGTSLGTHPTGVESGERAAPPPRPDCVISRNAHLGSNQGEGSTAVTNDPKPRV